MAAAELLIMPSYLESLSMVALEAWAMGKPVLANAKCDVLQGQCIRSNAGLFYENFPEFAETLRAIDTTPSLQAALGRNGRAFFERHYAWPVIEKKYVDMLRAAVEGIGDRRTMEPMPGWFARRRRSQPPAESIVKKLPAGPYREPSAAAQTASARARGRTGQRPAGRNRRRRQPRPRSARPSRPRASRPRPRPPQRAQRPPQQPRDRPPATAPASDGRSQGSAAGSDSRPKPEASRRPKAISAAAINGADGRIDAAAGRGGGGGGAR